MTNMKRIIIGGCAAAAVALGTGFAVAGPTSTAASPAPAKPTASQGRVITMDGYELGDSAQEAVAFSGNELVFEATVAGAPGKVRKVNRTFADGTKVEYHYTPIPVRVTRVRKGTGIKAGQAVWIRSLGGTLNGETTVSAMSPSASAYHAGQNLVLFTQPLLDAGDGLRAITANFTFVDDSGKGVVRSLTHEGLGKTIQTHSFQRLLAKVK